VEGGWQAAHLNVRLLLEKLAAERRNLAEQEGRGYNVRAVLAVLEADLEDAVLDQLLALGPVFRRNHGQGSKLLCQQIYSSVSIMCSSAHAVVHIV
jgi:hypothetical protein